MTTRIFFLSRHWIDVSVQLRN